MGKLFDKICAAVRKGSFLVRWHADEKCEERGLSEWQLIAGLEQSQLIRERPARKPHASVVVRQLLV